MKQQRFVKSNAVSLLEKLAFDEKRFKYPATPVQYLSHPKYRDDNTNGLTACIIDFIRIAGGQAERINSMGRLIDRRKTFVDVVGRSRTIGATTWVKGNTQTGTADISATIYGRSVKIEVKCKATGDRYQSAGQKDYQRMIEAAGGLYVIANDFEGFYQWYIKLFGHEKA